MSTQERLEYLRMLARDRDAQLKEQKRVNNYFTRELGL